MCNATLLHPSIVAMGSLAANIAAIPATPAEASCGCMLTVMGNDCC